MRKKLLSLLIISAMLVSALCLTGCGTATEDGVNIDDVDMGSADNTIAVQKYYASTTYLVEGVDEENGELMPPVEESIAFDENDNRYIAAVNSLKTVPEGMDMYSTMVSDQYTINDITVEDGVAYVDFSSDNLEGGTINEMVLIDQIVYTLSNTFDDVAAVKFTVDGGEADTLMGAVDISGVFVADYL